MSKFHYDILEELGEGTFGLVNKVQDKRTGEILAMKRISKTKIQRSRLGDQVKKEIDAMKNLKHINIVQIKEVLMDPNHLFIVMEYVQGGELYSKLAMKGKMSEKGAKIYFKQIMEAVNYCHSKNYCHRDIKCENILITSDDNVKIADFGFASVMQEEDKNVFEPIIEGKQSVYEKGESLVGGFSNSKPTFFRQESRVMRKMSTICGTSFYMAPEILQEDGYHGDKADIWSCGVVLYYMLTYSFPFQGKDSKETDRNICNNVYSIPASFSDDLVDIFSKILDCNPKTRWSARSILGHKWFESEKYKPSQNIPTQNIQRTNSGRIKTNVELGNKDSLISCILSHKNLLQCIAIADRVLKNRSWIHFKPDETTLCIKASKMTSSGHAMIQLEFKGIDKNNTIVNLDVFGKSPGSCMVEIISLMSYLKTELS